jgi:hypothetical protein
MQWSVRGRSVPRCLSIRGNVQSFLCTYKYIYIYIYIYIYKSVSRVAHSVHCLTTDRTAGVRSPTEAEDFSSNLCVQTRSGAHPASCRGGTGGFLSGGKARPGRDADHSPPSGAEVKIGQQLYLLSPRCASMERNGTALPFLPFYI